MGCAVVVWTAWRCEAGGVGKNPFLFTQPLDLQFDRTLGPSFSQAHRNQNRLRNVFLSKMKAICKSVCLL